MLSVFRNVLSIVTLCFFTWQIHGASYYVDYSGGSDVSSGASTSSAWKHCPGDPSATGIPSATALNAGDFVFFKGGVPYVLTAKNPSPASQTAAGIALNWFGTSGNPITYDGNSSGTWGSGRAIITDNNSPNDLAAFLGSATVSNLVFRSFYFTQIGGGALPPDPGGTNYAPNGIPAKPGYGIIASQMTGVLVRDCYFGQLGYYQQLAPIGNNSLAGIDIKCSTCNGLTITNCEFTQTRDPVLLGPSGNLFNVNIAHCNFHDQMEWAITVLHLTNTYRSNIYIFSCTFSNTDRYYVSTSQYGQWTGYGEGPHQNCIMMYGAEGDNGSYGLSRAVGDTNVVIYNNYCVNTLGYQGGSTCFWLQDGTSGIICNNVFNNCSANNEIKISGPATNTPLYVVIANNTIYGNATHLDVEGTAAFGYAWTLGTHGRNVIIENNLLSGVGIGNQNDFVFTVQVPASTFSQFTNNVLFNYNFYNSDQTLQATPHSMVYGLWSTSGLYLTTNSSPGTFGWDNNSWTANPLFAMTSKNNVAINDFHLQANSPVIGAGINLTSLGIPALNIDFAGNPRPSTGNWTIGAYQMGTQVQVGTPLTSVSMFAMSTNIIGGQSTELIWSSVNATSVSLTGFGQVPFSGSTNVAPTISTNYIITATGASGSVSTNLAITVLLSPPSQLSAH